MCVISRKPVGAKISFEIFEKMWDRNSDGAGFIGKLNANSPWVSQKGIMTFEEAKSIIEPYLGEESDLVLHFRIKSRGDTNAAMTHPFEWSRNDKEKRYFVHNGTIKLFTGFGGCSDTGHLSTLIQPVGTRSAYKIFEHLVKEKSGRFVTFVQKEDKEPEIKIFEDEESKWEDGVWYSNMRHLVEPTVVISGGSHHRGYTGTVTPPVFNDRTRTEPPLVKKIIDFYLERGKLVNSETNRNNIYEHYSLGFMCEDFLESISKKIDAKEQADPILTFFEL